MALALAACKDDGDAASDADTSTGASEDGGSSGDEASADDESGSTGEPGPSCGNGMLDPGEDCDEGLTDRHGPTCNAHCEVPATRLWTWDPDVFLLDVVALEGGDVGYLGWASETEDLRVGRMSPPSQVVWEHAMPLENQSWLRVVEDQLFLVGRPLDAAPGDSTRFAWSWSLADGDARAVAVSMGEVASVAAVPGGLLAIEDGWPTLSLRLHDIEGDLVWTAEQGQNDHSWQVADVAVLEDALVLALYDVFDELEDPGYLPELQFVSFDGQFGARVSVDVGPMRMRHLEAADGRLFAAGPRLNGSSEAGGWIAEVGPSGEVVHAFDDLDTEQTLSSFVVDSFGHPIVTGMRGSHFTNPGDGTLVRYGAQGPSWTIDFGYEQRPRVLLGEDDRLLVTIRHERTFLRAYTP